MPRPILLLAIDLHIQPHFDLSVVSDFKGSNEETVEQIYRCTVGARSKSEAYKKLQKVHHFPWWVAEHAEEEEA